MCTVSMIGDYYGDRWRDRWTRPEPNPYTATGTGTGATYIVNGGVSQEEFDALKKEVEQMRELLLRAKKYDEENGEPDCEMDDKVAVLRLVADLVGVSLEDVFGDK